MMWNDSAGWSGWPWMVLIMLLLVALLGFWPLHLLGKWRNDASDGGTASRQAPRILQTSPKPRLSKVDAAGAAGQNAQQEPESGRHDRTRPEGSG
jgi:hypothetical protein